MTGLLEAYEADGYRFSIEDNRLAIEADGELLNAQAVTRLAAHKAELIDQLRVRNFVKLVQAFAVCDYAALLDESEIRAELDADDLADLRTLDRFDLQCWAGMLAYRLTAERIKRWASV
jgi:hypothetical protein